MFDINEIQKRAQAASQRAAEDMKKSFEKSEEIQRGLQSANAPKTPCTCEEEVRANTGQHTAPGGDYGADIRAGYDGADGC